MYETPDNPEAHMDNTPFPKEIVDKFIKESNLPNVGTASIRELRKLSTQIEEAAGKKFIRMEMGIPGLPAPEIGIKAEVQALKNGVASLYPAIEGIPELRKEAARFVKNFMDIDLSPESFFATVGSMHGAFSALMVAGRMDKTRDTVLFIDPGFPVHKQLVKMIGVKYTGFDVYNHRGDALKVKLESYLKKGNISCVLYSNPNNPSWICFTELELKIIAELADAYNVLVMEDLAYFAMDFRKDLGTPGKPPFQATVARYTDNYILFISSSKAFSYAGQRVGILVIPPNIYTMEKPDLTRYYSSAVFGHSVIFNTLYATTAGVSHSAQHGLAALLKAANDGEYHFLEIVGEYGNRARIMKKLFQENGFLLVYDKDGDDPIADGFYFTIRYPGLSGAQLVQEFLYYGISAIALSTTGSDQEGIRACVSFVLPEQFNELEKRLKLFHCNHQ
ncbi:MAG: pyridoxal phosphate-dependent aminotransferase [Spirochaetales bacterium]|nr:pyridoxal phosphate-dependent aminotransferase [Spirochaetales bacterium]